MRRSAAPLSACLFAGAVLLVSPPATEAAALSPAGLQHQGMALDEGLLLARRGGGRGGFRGGMGGGGRAWGGGGGRGFAFRGGGPSSRAFSYRPGRAYTWRGGRARVWRGAPSRVWRGRRYRYWRGPRWRWGVAPYYGYSRCPAVLRRVWTPYGWRKRWVRRCRWW
jgi:hypothetical protein